jgi:hypothetical protein
MSAVNLLSSLRKVKRTGDGRWIACCPAHDDKRPSMTIRELPDGRVLMHCFSGCDTESILGAIGLDFSELFPEALDHHLPKVRQPFNPLDVLQCLQHESLITALGAAHIASGIELSEADKDRLVTAAGRLKEGYDLCRV